MADAQSRLKLITVSFLPHALGDSSPDSYARNPKAGRPVAQTWTDDNLNRMTASPLRVYENDVLGNRTWTNRTSQTLAVKYNWDLLNRMSATANISAGGARYEYRADGMRVLKVEGLSLVWVEEAENEEEEQEEGSGYWDEYWAANKPTTRYYYEGQMGIEEDFTRKVSGQDQTDVIRHGLGARGIDFIETDAYNASPSGAYPLYDGHGNMIATLTKQPTNSFSLSARRYTDPWGVTRVGASTGKPDQRYCANLGHRQDDESGLTYMRARYYEPTTGRFVSEDPAMDGENWYVYTANSPTNRVDVRGYAWEVVGMGFWAMGVMILSGAWFMAGLASSLAVPPAEKAQAWTAACFFAKRALVCFTIALNGADLGKGEAFLYSVIEHYGINKLIDAAVSGMAAGNRSHAAPAILAVSVYAIAVIAALIQSLFIDD